MPTLLAPVAGAIAQFDSFDVDGEDNAYRSHGDELKFWKNNGTGSNAIPTNNTIYGRPLLKKNTDEASVAFDGQIDGMGIPGSDSTFNFIHTTGVFDLFLCFRNKMGGKPIFGNTNQSSTAKGLTVFIDADGALTVSIGNGSAAIVLATGFELEVPLHEPTKLLIRGDGTNLKVSQNFFDFESVAFTGALGSGDAPRVYTIGETVTTPTMLGQFDMFWVSLYNSNLSAANLLTMVQAIQSRAGSQA